MMTTAHTRHYGCRIMDDLVFKGMRTLFLENELIRVGILLDKGADIFQFLHKPTDTDFLWRSPLGLRHPARLTPTSASAAGKFLDTYHGGWQEILPGGGPTIYKGAELGLHGEVAQLGWDYEILEDTEESIAVRLSVTCIRTPLQLERVLRLETNKPALFIDETLYNLSPETLEFMWGHHPAFGPPFLREGVKLFVPARHGIVHEPSFAATSIFEPGYTFDWPFISVDGSAIDLSQLPAEDAGYSDLLYLRDFKDGWYAVIDPERQVGFGLTWPLDVFPYLWFWLVYGEAPGYPWWNQVTCIALEPWTSIPNSLTEAIDQGTAALIKGGERIKVQLCAVAITGLEKVDDISLTGVVR